MMQTLIGSGLVSVIEKATDNWSYHHGQCNSTGSGHTEVKTREPAKSKAAVA